MSEGMKWVPVDQVPEEWKQPAWDECFVGYFGRNVRRSIYWHCDNADWHFEDEPHQRARPTHVMKIEVPE